MAWFREHVRTLGMLLHRRKVARELDEEMRLHRELRGDDRRFGNVLQLRERSLDMWGWRWLAELGQDVRHGLRLLARTPLLTAVALLSLTLGIGANTALFSLTDAVLLRALPVRDPGQLAQVMTRSPRATRPYPIFTNPMWEQLRGSHDIFDGAFAWSTTQFRLSQGGEQEMVPAMQASGGFFSTLGVEPVIGRLFGPGDDHPGCPAVADISESFWRSHLGGAASALGSTVEFSGHPFQVIGVTPASFFGVEVGARFDVAVPLCTEALTAPHSLLNSRDGWWLSIMGRLRPGLTVATASDRMAVLGPRVMAAAMPPGRSAARVQAYLDQRWSVQPAGLGAQGISRKRTQYTLPLEVLLAVAGVVLLVACANLAGLMMARATARRQEIAVRMTLGASRGRLIRQLLTESLLLALGGALCGAGFAAWACAAVQRDLAMPLNLAVDPRVLAFTIGVAVASGLLVGILPAVRATDVALAASARPGAHTARRTGGLGGNRYIVAAQIALSLVLVAGAGLFLRSFVNLMTVNTGFNPDHLFLVQVSPTPKPPNDAAVFAARAAALAQLRRLPGVGAASESFMVPTTGLMWDGSLRDAGGAAAIPEVYFNAVSPAYFATMGTPLLRGRGFRAADSTAAPAVMIVNQALARQMFPRGNALGQSLRSDDDPVTPGPPVLIIGITADADYGSLRQAPPPTAYYPLAQLPSQFPTTAYELRSQLPPATLAREVKAAFALVAPTTSYHLGTMSSEMAATLKPERLLATLSALFGGLALLLTAIGLYGVMAYLATERRQEFGVRLALGARSSAILGLMMRETAALLAWGAAWGAIAAWIAGRALQARIGGLLFGLSADDLATLGYAAAALATVALLAAARPAQRAARLDPMRSLREE